MATFRYSRWDGSQQVFGLHEDELLESLSDDILAHGDIDRALRSLFQRGTTGEGRQERIEGLRDLLDRLRQQRKEQLERHKLDSLMDDIKERLEDVVETERSGIDTRIQEARQKLAEAGEQAGDLMPSMRVLEDRASRNRDALDELPESVPGAVKALQDYDFLDPEARRKYQDLMDLLDRAMTDDAFQQMRQQLQELSPEDLEDQRAMLHALNEMLQDRAMGREPDFDGFMERFGHNFDPDRPSSLDELIDRLRQRMEAAQSLVDGMSPEMREELQQLTESTLGEGLMRELAELAGYLQPGLPQDDMLPAGVLAGDSLTLEEAMRLMERLQALDDLEQQIQRSMPLGDIESIDPDEVDELVGEEARRVLERLQHVVEQLREAGYLKQEDGRLELSSRGLRKIAQQALSEVFSALKKDRSGRHEAHHRGDGGEYTWETKAYEFGDPMDIDLNRTLFNSVLREGPNVPVTLSPEDLEVRRTEHLTQAATVLLLDQSRSMGMFGNFGAAKKVALALYWLIQSKYPRDYFSVIGFSDYAIEIHTDELAGVAWNDWVAGTNMHHAFMLSNRLLSKQKVATKQILMITDGEPTAHLEGDEAYFGYPPSYRTIDLTLKEVKRCTRSGITINTFMLAHSQYLMAFVDKMTRINRGRAFYTTPDKLGRYIMVDYLRSRRRLINR